MTERDTFGERRQTQEDEYFRKREQELIQKMRQRAETDATRQQLAERSGIADPAVLQDLEALGYTPDTVRLLLERGANANAESTEGERPLDVDPGDGCQIPIVGHRPHLLAEAGAGQDRWPSWPVGQAVDCWPAVAGPGSHSRRSPADATRPATRPTPPAPALAPAPARASFYKIRDRLGRARHLLT